MDVPTIWVACRNEFGTTTKWDIQVTVPLTELLQLYCDEFDISRFSLQLRMHTSRMLIDLSETPQSLGLKDGDVLDVLYNRTLMPVPLAKRSTKQPVLKELQPTAKSGWTNVSSTGPPPTPTSGLVWREEGQTWFKPPPANSSGSGDPTGDEAAFEGGRRKRLRITTPSPEHRNHSSSTGSGQRALPSPLLPPPVPPSPLPPPPLAPPMPQLPAPPLRLKAQESGPATLPPPSPLPAEKSTLRPPPVPPPPPPPQHKPRPPKAMARAAD
jgi:hypothetical protein